MSAIVTIVFSVTAAFVALVVTAAWLWWSRGSKRARVVFGSVLVGYTIAAMWIVPHTIGTRVLARGFAPYVAAPNEAGPTAIVVLGPGNYGVASWDDRIVWVLESTGAARVAEALRVYRQVQDGVIFSSGGLPAPDPHVEPSALTMRTAFVAAGVPASRIVVQAAPRNTHEEALLIAPMLRAAGARRVVLVTTDVHMRRALAVFRAAGVDAMPAIARDPYDDGAWDTQWLPSAHGLHFTGQLVHEVLGLAAYRARGWL